MFIGLRRLGKRECDHQPGRQIRPNRTILACQYWRCQVLGPIAGIAVRRYFGAGCQPPTLDAAGHHYRQARGGRHTHRQAMAIKKEVPKAPTAAVWKNWNAPHGALHGQDAFSGSRPTRACSANRKPNVHVSLQGKKCGRSRLLLPSNRGAARSLLFLGGRRDKITLCATGGLI